MLAIHRTVRRVALMAAAAVLAGSLSGQSAHAAVVYSTGFGTFGGTDTWTNGSTTDGVDGYISGTASASIQSNPSAYTSNAFSTPGTVNNPSWQGAPAFSSQALQLVRSAGGAAGVGPNLSSLTTVNSATQNSTVTISTYVGSVPASGTGTGPFVGLDLFGNNDAVAIGSFGIDESTGNVVYSLNGVNYTVSSQTVAPISATGEYDQLQLVAAFTGGNGTTAGSIQLTGYVDGNLAFTGTSAAVGDVITFSHAYMFAGTLDTPTDTNSAYTAYFGDYQVSQSLSAIPEPGTMTLMTVCGVLLAGRRKRKVLAV